jgi:hypothetical protein
MAQSADTSGLTADHIAATRNFHLLDPHVLLAKRRLERGVFKGVVDLQAAINRFVVDHNQQPKPFVWTADPDKIIAAAARGHQVPTSVR